MSGTQKCTYGCWHTKLTSREIIKFKKEIFWATTSFLELKFLEYFLEIKKKIPGNYSQCPLKIPKNPLVNFRVFHIKTSENFTHKKNI